MSKAFFVPIPNRGRILIEGADARSFLQGLLTNSVEQADDRHLIYACLLSPQGKFLHDMFIHAPRPDMFALECEGGPRTQDLYDRLMKYKLRTKITLTIEKDVNVYAVFGDDKTGLPDPRHACMGQRSFDKPDLEERPFEEWDTIRIQNTIPDGSRDMEFEKSTLLDFGIDKLNGIDWNKGCYVGQEVTARMHYRGLVKKHLYTVKLARPAPPPFSDLPNGGSMRSSCGSWGLALMRDEERLDVIE